MIVHNVLYKSSLSILKYQEVRRPVRYDEKSRDIWNGSAETRWKKQACYRNAAAAAAAASERSENLPLSKCIISDRVVIGIAHYRFIIPTSNPFYLRNERISRV